MTQTIEISLAQPIDGEGVEDINMEKYTDEVLEYVKSIHSSAEIEISWISNNGTASTKVWAEDEDGGGRGGDFQTDVEETVMLAEERAYTNPANYGKE